jgi:hypothetical protein
MFTQGLGPFPILSDKQNVLLFIGWGTSAVMLKLFDMEDRINGLAKVNEAQGLRPQGRPASSEERRSPDDDLVKGKHFHQGFATDRYPEPPYQAKFCSYVVAGIAQLCPYRATTKAPFHR